MNLFNYTRTECCVCGASAFVGSFVTKPIPIFQGCLEPTDHVIRSESQTWISCEACGCCQLAHVPNSNFVYQAAHAESAGRLWLEHHAAFAEIVKEFAAPKVVEIGGGTGLLAEQARKIGVTSHWTNVEPNPLKRNDIKDYEAYTGFLETAEPELFHSASIVFSHCLEHVQDLGATLSHLSSIQSVGERVLVSWPNLEDWIGYRKPGALNWEHTFFISVNQLINIFGKHHYALLKRLEWRDHSVFLCFEHTGKELQSPVEQSKHYLSHVEQYFTRFEETGKELDHITATYTGDAIYVCPASVYSQYIVSHMESSAKLRGVLDGSPQKQGKALYGTGLTVYPYEALHKSMKSLIILCAGDHTSEIRSHIENNFLKAEIHVVD